MNYGADTCIINIAATRQILGYENVVKWTAQSEDQNFSTKILLELSTIRSNQRIYNVRDLFN